MKKNIRDVRKNIADRKKRKMHHKGTSPPRAFSPPQDEEIHGFPPLVTSPGDKGIKQNSQGKGTSHIGIQILFAALLFAVVALGKNSDVALVKAPGDWAVSQMQEEFPFAKVTAWYSDRFGEPLEVIQPLEENGQEPLAMPVNGTVTTPFQNDGKGIVLTTEDGSPVKAVREGTVIFAGNDPDSGKTVVLQHNDGSKTTYGYLSTIDVHLYEHVQSQKDLGSVKAEEGQQAEFFFAIEKDNTFLDPAQVIKVNEGP
ncbi:stage IV sporulation protein FA [Halobacillus karajensis]|uniref:Stage IV sporulation protein FA n=1 Tax=Halobacillus karajensis TaxID=195088 RepID=A0A024P803_9BACI|nr:M23 family metallopeptidase [Halobacillus karajensis]CDQ18136.1 Stage IV sporulation protein FA [Halobacillus karajensis]CDQ24487.1 Stage IV sporulation protein FA [Halobacillus karajensis]CDQ29265.1 Stage IV sporulation protein FA [Halobacillus karajensis]SEH58563.1 stage IV sporulation protein FA [Halobacillus karajensis]